MSQERIDTVTLYAAFYWDCPNCKQRNWAEGVQVPEDIAEEAIRADLELEDWEELPEHCPDLDELIKVPEEVECQKCHVCFFTKDEADDS